MGWSNHPLQFLGKNNTSQPQFQIKFRLFLFDKSHPSLITILIILVKASNCNSKFRCWQINRMYPPQTGQLFQATTLN